MNTASDVIIHIGLPKVGSTYIKRSIFARASKNIIVPRGKMYRALREESLDVPGYRNFVESLVQNDTDRVIFTNEALSGGFENEQGVFNVAENLEKVFGKAKVLFMVREQLSYMESVYTYGVRKGMQTQSFSDFIGNAWRTGNLQNKLKYHRLIEKYITLFGKENVLVLPFELLCSDESAFSDRIRAFTGLGVNYEAIETYENKSPKDEGVIEFLRKSNRWIKPYLKMEHLLFKRSFTGEFTITNFRKRQAAKPPSYYIQHALLQRSNQYRNNNRIRLAEDLCGSLREEFAQSNLRTSELISIDLAGYGYAT